MSKLAKGLTLVAGGVPAAAIITACVINASPNADASTETVHTENLAAETDTAPKPPPAAPYALVQPRSMAPPGATSAKPHKHAGGGHRTQTIPDPQASPGAVVPSEPLTPPTAPVQDEGPAYVPTGPPSSTPPPVSTGHPAPAPRTTHPAPGGQTTSPPRRHDPAPAGRTHPAPHRKQPDPVRHTDEESSPARDGKPADQAPVRTPGTTHSTPERSGRAKPDAATTSPDRASTGRNKEAAPTDTNANEASVSHMTVAGIKQRLGKKVVTFAKAQLGKPYVFGAEGPHAYDCSGLVQAAYKAAGINVPRTSDVQYWFGKRVHAGQERPGDLVFFDYKPGHSGPGHVGIVMDPAKGLMIVAPHTGDHVKVQSYKRYPGGPTGFTRPLDRPDMQHKLARMAK